MNRIIECNGCNQNHNKGILSLTSGNSIYRYLNGYKLYMVMMKLMHKAHRIRTHVRIQHQSVYYDRNIFYASFSIISTRACGETVNTFIFHILIPNSSDGFRRAFLSLSLCLSQFVIEFNVSSQSRLRYWKPTCQFI